MSEAVASVREPARHPTDKRNLHSKGQAIGRLQDSALKLFSRHGFDGASLRDIALDASVPLSTIDRYFGTKLNLFLEIESSIWKKVTTEREVLLKRALDVSFNNRPALDAVLYAFAQPIVRRAFEGPCEASTLRLMREYAAMRVHNGFTHAPKPFARVAEQWINAIMKSRPDLPRRRAVWMLSFVMAVTFSDQLQHGWYDELMPSSSQETNVDEVTKMVVTFCRAGIDAAGDFT